MSDLASESLQNLQAKRLEHESNLSAIEAAIEADPNAEELLKLKSDLQEVISFFRDLIAQKLSEKLTAGQTLSDIELSVPQQSKDGGIDEEEDSTVTNHKPSATFGLIGRTCIMSSTLKFGEIIGVGSIDKQSELPLTVQVKWFGAEDTDNEVEELPAHSVRLLTPIPAESVHVGIIAQALYSGDGQWYKCVVNAILEDGKKYSITYPEYEEEEIIPADRLRPADVNIAKLAPNNSNNNANASSAKEQEKKRVKEVVTPAGYVIPMNLIVKPGDTEAQRAGKRRRLTKLKKDQKLSAAEEEARERQSSWQSHARKASTKTTARLQTALLRAKEGRIPSSRSD